ncbi:uncharacterized protein [Aegilops tauschii subsp. strangulata]|uniref:uncharacterized protein n=1 Tax=Aegilops tauschii subsp. strangulata TaxID=200361 RepID=UPI00098B726F
MCKFIIIFLDDILVFSIDLQEHEEHLRLTLNLLREHQLFAKAIKCSLAQTSIEYLGHVNVISQDGVATDTSKTSAMQPWPMPTTPTELCGFLGLTDYYRNPAPRAALPRPGARFKKEADRHRAERAFDVGERVLLKLQPYAQSSVANHPYRKLSYKFYGPFMVAAWIGTLAYRLQLPADSCIHPVFHVSQLKPFTPDYTPVFSELPRVPHLVTGESEPVAILERHMMKKGDVRVIQLQIQWSNMPLAVTTWEDYDTLKEHYPTACIWDGAPSQGRDNVTTADDISAVD